MKILSDKVYCKMWTDSLLLFAEILHSKIKVNFLKQFWHFPFFSLFETSIHRDFYHLGSLHQRIIYYTFAYTFGAVRFSVFISKYIFP